MSKQYETDRLILRQWQESDRPIFREIETDPAVMEFYPKIRTEKEGKAFVDAQIKSIDEQGYGLWAVELKGTGEFIGYVGLIRWEEGFHFAPATEVGWMMAKKHWGKGYAPEAARKALQVGFQGLGLTEIVSMTAVVNKRSIRVMEKIGMSHDPADDFDHPRVQDNHPLQRHVLYRIGVGDADS